MITNARTGSSREMASREKQYVITMAFRMACFISIFFVHGWVRWVVLAGAVFLPFIAVLFANQANQKSAVTVVQRGGPTPAGELTVGDPVEVIEGQLVDGDPAAENNRSEHFGTPGDEGWSRRDRVA